MGDRIVYTLEQPFYKHSSRSNHYMFQFAHIRIFKGFNPTLPKDTRDYIANLNQQIEAPFRCFTLG